MNESAAAVDDPAAVEPCFDMDAGAPRAPAPVSDLIDAVGCGNLQFMTPLDCDRPDRSGWYVSTPLPGPEHEGLGSKDGLTLAPFREWIVTSSIR